jgi:hypothetical protein
MAYGTSYGLLYNPRPRYPRFVHKEYALGFSISQAMMEDDLYGPPTKAILMHGHKLDVADKYMMRQMQMDEYDYLVYIWDSLYNQMYLTLPEINEMHGANASMAQGQVNTPSANYPGKMIPMPPDNGGLGVSPPRPIPPILAHAGEVSSMAAEMNARRDTITQLRESLHNTDPRDPNHLRLVNEISSTFRAYAELADRLYNFTA